MGGIGCFFAFFCLLGERRRWGWGVSQGLVLCLCFYLGLCVWISSCCLLLPLCLLYLPSSVSFLPSPIFLPPPPANSPHQPPPSPETPPPPHDPVSVVARSLALAPSPLLEQLWHLYGTHYWPAACLSPRRERRAAIVGPALRFRNGGEGRKGHGERDDGKIALRETAKQRG